MAQVPGQPCLFSLAVVFKGAQNPGDEGTERASGLLQPFPRMFLLPSWEAEESWGSEPLN